MTVKKITSLSLAAALTLSLMGGQTASASAKFVDISSSHEIYDELTYLSDYNVSSGYLIGGSRYFKPDNNVTKAQASIMVINALGYKTLRLDRSSFKDVKVGTSVSLYAERVRKMGYVELAADGNFNPNKAFTLNEASYMLANAFKLNADQYTNQPVPYTDVPKSSKYYKYISALYHNGILAEATKINPNQAITRGEFVEYVARAKNSSFRLTKEVQGVVSPTQNDSIGKVEVTENNLNVRSSRNSTISTNKLGQVNKGTILTVYEDQYGWLKVEYKGKTGYIFKEYTKYIEKVTEQPESTPSEKPDENQTENPEENQEKPTQPSDNESNQNLPIGKVEVTVDNLNVRSSANSSISTNKIGQVDTGTILEVYEDKGEWLKVSYKNRFAYISKEYTKYITDVPVIDEETEETPEIGEEPVEVPDHIELDGDVIGRVTVDGLRLRSGPGASYETLDVLNTGDKVVVHSISKYWAKVTYGNKEGYTHKSYLKLLNQSDNVLENRIIVIDPGHGGKDPGTHYSSYTEKDIVFKVSNLVKQKLEDAGATVVMTRTGDTYPTLQDRVDITNNKYGEIFISIHVNSADSKSANGTETYYSITTGDMYREDIDLATYINNEIVKNADMANRGVRNRDFYVVRNMIIPSVLVELGFLSNSADRAKLIDSEYVEIYADSIYNGIVKYYSKQ
nr:N-acetylmuramoyl-L-alanine amidase [Lysinibacillus timonensis]